MLAAAVIAFLCVALGAFAAHALGDSLAGRAQHQFELGIRYAFYHALAILGAGLALPIAARPRCLSQAAGLLILGTGLFSGSLLLLALTQLNFFAILTPVGGLCLLAAWGWFAFSMLPGRGNSGES